MMRAEEFNAVYVGEHERELHELVGPPQEVEFLQAGMKQFTYVERVRIGNGREIFRQYILLLSSDGRVLNKRVNEISPPAVRFQM
jgi:hypothetical protein